MNREEVAIYTINVMKEYNSHHGMGRDTAKIESELLKVTVDPSVKCLSLTYNIFYHTSLWILAKLGHVMHLTCIMAF